MHKEEKNQLIDVIDNMLNENNNFYLADISGLTAEESSSLRRLCYKREVSLQVVKNTLLKKALERNGVDFSSLYDVLTGNTSIMRSEESGNAPAKVIKEFRKKHKKPILKAAHIEETFYIGDEHLGTLSDLKSKNELIGDIITLLQSPAKNVVSALQSGGSKLSGIIKSLQDDVSREPSKNNEVEDKKEVDQVEDNKEVDQVEDNKEVDQVEDKKEVDQVKENKETNSSKEE